MPLNWLCPSRRSRSAAKPKPKRAVLCVERLEDRLAPAIFNNGYVLLGLSTGDVEIHDPTQPAGSTFIQSLNTGSGRQAHGMAFDSAGNLYVTTFTSSGGLNGVIKFDPDGVNLGGFGSGYTGRPESIAFDDQGVAYVGINSNGGSNHRIKLFNADGSVKATYSNLSGSEGTDWTQLSPDLKTLVYTAEDKGIYRVNAATGAQLSPITTTLPGTRAFALRFLPTDCEGVGGGLIVADSATIVQLNGAGTQTFTYDTATASTVNDWFALNRDPDAVTFWSAGLRDRTVYRFNYGSAAPIQSFTVNASLGSNDGIVGIAVVGELLTFPADSTPPMFAVGTEAGSSIVNVYDPSTKALVNSFEAFAGFTGGVRVAMADVSGDAVADIIVAVAQNGPAHIKVFDGNNPAVLLQSFIAFGGYNGGLNVAAGDINGDGFAEIIVGANAVAPHVKVFNGRTQAELFSFYAFAPNFGGGVRVAVGDIDSDGRPDIVAGAGPGAGPHVRVFSGADASPVAGPLGSFFAFDASFRGGVTVAVGRVNAGCKLEIIVGAGSTVPHVKVFNGDTGAVIHSFYAGPLGFLFFPDGQRYRTGVNVAATDFDGDGLDDILTGFGGPGFPQTKGFSGVNLAVLDDFFAFGSGFAGGISVGGKLKLKP